MILTAKQLKKVFNRRVVFKDISFEVKSGEVLSITGPNGSGKSTASKMICGILTPTSGEIILSNGVGRIERDEVHRHVGFVSPYLELYGEFTAFENLQIELRARRFPRTDEKKILETLKLVGLFNRKDDALKGFSSGMKQRLKYAAALIHDPEVLVLDEPTANLDQAGVDMVLSVIERYRRDRIVVLATNDSQEAALGDVKVVLKKDLGSENGK
ncbi:MAG: ABC transporter ATP-binding protein [Bacteroidetes bacterium]|nr:ABC transporter ATP-binding protein [Bacteroidota bacterium]